MRSLQLRAGRLAGARALLLIALFIPVSCHKPAVPDDPGGPVLRVGVGIGRSLKASGVNSLTHLFYSEPLLNRELDGRFTPRLATAWDWEQNGRRLRIKVKPGVVMHDGTPVTAELVAAELQTLMPKPNEAGEWGFNYVTGVSVPGPNTVVIELSQPDIFLLAALSELRIVHPTSPNVATGPFRIVSPTPQFEAARFGQYHGGETPLAGVKIVHYETQRSAWAALMRGEVDVVQEVSRESVEFMENSARVRTYSSLQPFYVPLVFNVRHPILKKVEVRRALVQALSPNEILDRALHRRGRVAEGPIWPLHWAYEAGSVQQPSNPDEARAALDRAGHLQPKATRTGELRTRFALRCLVNSEDPQDERVALMVQRQLFDVGVHLEIELLPMESLHERITAGQFETYMVRTNASRTLERTYNFWRSSGPMNTATQNSGYTGADALLDQLRRSTSDEELRSAVRALAERFRDDAPAAFIAWLQITRAVDGRFDVGATPGDDPFANIWRWKLAGAVQ